MTTPEQRAKAFEQWHDKHENRLILMDAVEIAETVWNAAWELATQATSTAAQVDTLKRIRDDIILDRQDAEYYKRIMLVHIKWCREALSAAPPQGKSSVPIDLLAIGELLRTQDNRITDQPLFAVQQKRRILGVDTDDSSLAWVNIDSGAELTEGKHFDDLEREYDETSEEPGNWRRLGYIDMWEFVTACFTEQGCNNYIAKNGHNLKEPRIYAYGTYRNDEYRAVRNWLKELPPPPSQKKATQEGDA